jgi:hypothetical protein
MRRTGADPAEIPRQRLLKSLGSDPKVKINPPATLSRWLDEIVHDGEEAVKMGYYARLTTGAERHDAASASGG